MRKANIGVGLLLAAMIVSVAWQSSARAQDTVRVEIRVKAPQQTPADAKLYLAGNLDQVGSWKVQGVQMRKGGDGTWSVELHLPKGQTLEYKINRGAWETVEKGSNGEEIANRTLSLEADKTDEISVAAWADGGKTAPATGPAKSTVTGDVHYHEHFHSEILHNDRTVIVWLPPHYADDPARRFPVLYLHDGQNCFDASTSFAGEWQADETADRLIRSGEIQPIIMAAVANAGPERMNEYTPTRDATRNTGGRGELYAQFLITELKPFIDRTYRTMPDRANTAVAGSSLGGLISLYLGVKHGDVFGAIGVMSPSLFWDNRSLLKEIQADPARLKDERVWIDIGTAEGSGDEQSENVENTKALADALARGGEVAGRDFKYLAVAGAKHNEPAWAARFGQVLIFFFGK